MFMGWIISYSYFPIPNLGLAVHMHVSGAAGVTSFQLSDSRTLIYVWSYENGVENFKLAP